MFSPIQIKHLASFVKSLKGTNPPNPKAPQGVLITDAAKADTAITNASTTTN
jgi:cytochrome c oxidase cbb3-type subunit 3